MQKILKIELHRAFINWTFGVSIAIGCTIAISHLWFQVIPSICNLDNYLLGKGEYPVSVFNKWIGGEGISLQSALYNMLLPCLAILPYGDSLFCDKKSGYIKNILIKTSKKKFFLSKMISAFLSGAVACTVPLLLNLVLSAACLPSIIPESSSMTFPLFERSMFSNLFYKYPYRYIFIYLTIIFVFSGLFSCLALGLSYYVEKKYEIYIIPLIVYMLIDFVAGCIGFDCLSPKSYLRIDQPVPASFEIILIEYLVGMGLFICIYCYKGKKDEII